MKNRNILTKCLKVIAISVLFIVFSLYGLTLLIRVFMHSGMISRRDQIAAAIRFAEKVRLEEFGDDAKILSRRELAAEQRIRLKESIGGDLTGGAPFTLTMYFVPHHRVVTRDSKGMEFVFTICFQCDEAAITGSNPFLMPIKWRTSLRKLFEDNGFRVSKSGE